MSALDPSDVASNPVWFVHVLPKGRDEIGAMLTSLATMPVQWRVLVRQIRKGVNEVSSSSVEISAANTDLSARTERGTARPLVTQLSASLSFRQAHAHVQTRSRRLIVTFKRIKLLTLQSLSQI